MKILLVTNYQPPHMGGIEFAAASLKKCWQERGHDVTWLTTDIPFHARPQTTDNIRVGALNFLETFFQLNTPIINPLSYIDIDHLVKTHDAIMVHSLAPGLTSVTIHAALMRKKPLIVTQHVGIIPMKGKFRTWAQDKFLIHMAKRCIRGGARITFVGEAVRKWFKEHANLPDEKVHMTPAGIDHDDYYFVDEKERKEVREKWGLYDEEMNVLFVGRFYDKKGLPLLKKVIAQCPEIRFTFIGSGPIDPTKWDYDNVHVIPFLPINELREIYGAHDLLILPSVGEGWPAVVPQAMACGLPCLISDEAHKGYGRDARQFLICERDVNVIVDTLKTAHAGDMHLIKQRRMLSEYAMETWDWAKTAAQYIEIAYELQKT